MASIIPPSSSPAPNPTTAPRLESAAWFALAIKLLQTKPSSLSIPEYFALLRSNTVSGGRSLDGASERRHIEACEFWRKRFEAEATRVVELQARVNELTGKFNALSETSKVNRQTQNAPKNVDQPQAEGPAKKKAKVTGKRAEVGKDVKRKANLAGGQRKAQQQQVLTVVAGKESFFDETFSSFSGSSISDLVASLRLLHFVREPHLVSRTIAQSSQALRTVIQDFITGKLSTPIYSAHLTRGATITQAKVSQGTTNFSQTVEKSCNRILSALSALVASSQGKKNDWTAVKNDEFIADGIGAVIKNMIVILSSIQKNSRELLSAALFPLPQISKGDSPVKDIRLELTMLLIRQLTNLDLTKAYQRNILEGTFYHLLEIISDVLLRSFMGASNSNGREELLTKIAVEETSWYLLRILEAVLPFMTSSLEAGDGKLENNARERLGSVLVKCIFNSEMEGGQKAGGREQKGNDGVEFWKGLDISKFSSDTCITDTPFSRVLWELLGLDILAG